VGEVASHRFEETRLSVRKFAPHEWRLYRDLRLRALRELPDAFGSTFAREAERTDDEWTARLSAGAVRRRASAPPVSACRLCADGTPRLCLGPSPPRLHIFEERMTLRIGGILEAHVGADCEVRRRKMRGPRARAPFMDA
jgi:hypothetical protein